MRNASRVTIVGYDPRHKQAFKKLNEVWIDKHFVMEEADRLVLDHPEEHIIDQGGEVLFAIDDERIVGTCALIKVNHGSFDFELAKMAVDSKLRGNGIGYKLGVVAIEKSKELGAKSLFLQSNTVLAPAIRLYGKLGFTEIPSEPTPYTRCNIQMSLEF